MSLTVGSALDVQYCHKLSKDANKIVASVAIVFVLSVSNNGRLGISVMMKGGNKNK